VNHGRFFEYLWLVVIPYSRSGGNVEMDQGKSSVAKPYWVNAAIWNSRQGCWVAILVIVPVVKRQQAIAKVAKMLNYRFSEDSGRTGGSLYLVSVGTHVYLLRATSSDDARVKVRRESGCNTKRSVKLFTMKCAPHPHRSLVSLVDSTPPWRCGNCGCYDLTLHRAETQICPCCGRQIDPTSRDAVDREWPDRELDPTLFAIDRFFDDCREPADQLSSPSDSREDSWRIAEQLDRDLVALYTALNLCPAV